MPAARALLGAPCGAGPCLAQGLHAAGGDLLGRASPALGATLPSLVPRERALRELAALTLPPLLSPPAAPPLAPSPVPPLVSGDPGSVTMAGGTGFIIAVLAAVHLLFLVAALGAFVLWRRTVREEERRRRERAAAGGGGGGEAGEGLTAGAQRRGGLDPDLLASLPTLIFEPSAVKTAPAHPGTTEVGGGRGKREGKGEEFGGGKGVGGGGGEAGGGGWGEGEGGRGGAGALLEALAGAAAHPGGGSTGPGESPPQAEEFLPASPSASKLDGFQTCPASEASNAGASSDMGPALGSGARAGAGDSQGSRGAAGALGAQSECSVCLQEYRPGEALKLLPDCGHSFHGLCIQQWLGSHSTCPICRVQVGPAVQKMAKEPPEAPAC